MRTFLFAVLISLVVIPSFGQTMTFRAEFDGYDVYTQFISIGSVDGLETWRVDDGNCTFYVSPIDYNGNRVKFYGGTTWDIEPKSGGIEITFPKGETVFYEETDKDPRVLCGFKGKKT